MHAELAAPLPQQELALRMRLLHRIPGRFVGLRSPGNTQAREEVLPVLLLREEAALALSRSWIRLSHRQSSTTTPTTQGASAGQQRGTKRERETDGHCGDGGEGISTGAAAGQRQSHVGEGQILAHRNIKVSIALAAPQPTVADSGVSPKLASGVDGERCGENPPDAAGLRAQDEAERCRFLIFERIWERGFWLTAGLLFGGDFLAYPVRSRPGRSPRQRHAAGVCGRPSRATLRTPVRAARLTVATCNASRVTPRVFRASRVTPSCNASHRQGDPRTHHAALVVSVVPHRRPIRAGALVGLGRTCAAAGKRLLVASVDSAGKPRMLTLAFSASLSAVPHRA
jgi:tRNA splicing endonuclease